MVRALYLFACSIISILFDDLDWQGGVLKVTKNGCFLVVLAAWFIFLKFLGRLRSGLC